jgi:hypothetical protein
VGFEQASWRSGLGLGLSHGISARVLDILEIEHGQARIDHRRRWTDRMKGVFMHLRSEDPCDTTLALGWLRVAGVSAVELLVHSFCCIPGRQSRRRKGGEVHGKESKMCMWSESVCFSPFAPSSASHLDPRDWCCSGRRCFVITRCFAEKSCMLYAVAYPAAGMGLGIAGDIWTGTFCECMTCFWAVTMP